MESRKRLICQITVKNKINTTLKSYLLKEYSLYAAKFTIVTIFLFFVFCFLCVCVQLVIKNIVDFVVILSNFFKCLTNVYVYTLFDDLNLKVFN